MAKLLLIIREKEYKIICIFWCSETKKITFQTDEALPCLQLKLKSISFSLDVIGNHIYRATIINPEFGTPVSFELKTNNNVFICTILDLSILHNSNVISCDMINMSVPADYILLIGRLLFKHKATLKCYNESKIEIFEVYANDNFKLAA